MNRKILIIGIVLILLYLNSQKKEAYDNYTTEFDFNLPTPALIKETRNQGEYKQRFVECQPNCGDILSGDYINGTDDYNNSYSCPTYIKNQGTPHCTSGDDKLNWGCENKIGVGSPCCIKKDAYGYWHHDGDLYWTPINCGGGPIFQDIWVGTCQIENSVPCSGIGCVSWSKWDCNDGIWSIHGMSWYRANAPSGTSDAYSSNGKLQLNGGVNADDSSAKYLVDLSNKDVKIDLITDGRLEIKFGDNSIPLPSIQCGSSAISILIEFTKDILNKNRYFVNVNGEEVANISVTIPAYIQFTQKICSYIDDNGDTKYSGSTTVYSLKSRPFFVCSLEDNEVFVRQTFEGGTTFTIDDLQLKPITKFCLDSYPAVLRNLTAGIRADLRGDITRALARKETIMVPDNTYLEITYATFYQVGIDDICNPGEIYDIKRGVCEQFLVERPPEYIIIREHEYIPIGKDQRHFTNSLIIGDKKIEGNSKPSFLCEPREMRLAEGNCNTVAYQCEQTEDCIYSGEEYKCRDKEPSDWNAPYPLPPPELKSCWRTSVSFDGDSWQMYDGDEIDLNDYLKLKYYASAHYEGDEGKITSWTNNFILTLKNMDFLQLSPIRGDKMDYWVLFGTDKQMCFNLDNKLVNFNSEQSGYYLKATRTSLIQSQYTDWIKNAFLLGLHQKCIPVESNELGEIQYEIMPYFYLGNEMFFDNERITYNYHIVSSVEDYINYTVIYQDRDCRDEGYTCPSNYLCNQGTGTCDRTITISCLTVDCPSDYECNQQTGVCEREIIKDCRTQNCPSGSNCTQSGGYYVCKEPYDRDCRQLGCSYGTCNEQTGVCESIIDCRNTECPSGSSCTQSGGYYVCKETTDGEDETTTPSNFTWVFWVIGFFMFLIMLKSMRRK